jgi:post-segregation antitoxin (ccd killing protein)
MASGYAKISVTLPASLVERIKTRVGARGVSSYVAHALEAEERREALRRWLAEQDAEYGSLPRGVLEEVQQQWLGDGDPVG